MGVRTDSIKDFKRYIKDIQLHKCDVAFFNTHEKGMPLRRASMKRHIPHILDSKKAMGIRVKRELLPKARLHKPHRQVKAAIQTSKSSSIDPATPRAPTKSTLARLRKRRERKSKSTKKPVAKFTVSEAMKAAKSGKPPPTRKLKPDLSCYICLADKPSGCMCGFNLIDQMDGKAYCRFRDFIYNPKNPFLHDTDPEDQRSLQAMIAKFCSTCTASSQHELALTGVCFFLGCVGSAQSMEDPAVCAALGNRSCASLRSALENRDGPVFRGGQRPFHRGVRGLADALQEHYKSLGPITVQAMADFRTKRGTGKIKAVQSLMQAVSGCQIFGFGPYFQKKYLELLALAGSIRAGGFQMLDEDWNFGAATFPVAKNSKEGLQLIFPSATTDALAREGIQTLIRALAHRGTRLPFARIHALLCFLQKDDGGVLRIAW